MALKFEWDSDKADLNVRKHGIDFFEAVSVFADPLSLTIADESHSVDEHRFNDIGRTNQGHLLVVVYAQQGDVIRIISARKATKNERAQYEEG
jgi:uncharacterized DUF497 family protein